MNFSDFVCFKATVPTLTATERDGAITEMVASLDEAGALPAGSLDEITAAVIERENEASTGLGRGVAVPHVKYEGVEQVIGVVAQSDTGIDFSALDKQPVYSIILLVSPKDNPERHLQAMEGVFAHLQKEKFRRFLRQCKDQAAVEDLLREADQAPSW
jgi:mannitol/fructose-specific phosphotransferase system IIA component (Ntr-type)